MAITYYYTVAFKKAILLLSFAQRFKPICLNFFTVYSFLHSVQFITAKYIYNCCVLFAHWFSVLQYSVNDPVLPIDHGFVYQ